MKVAVYGKSFNKSFNSTMEAFFTKLSGFGAEVLVYEPFMNFIHESLPQIEFDMKVFKAGFPENLDFMFSIGGDGTFLEAARLVKGLDVPLVGVNSGRLGFLAYIAREDISSSLDEIFEGRYSIEERTILEMTSSDGKYSDFALNEIALQKSDSRMLTIHAYLNGELLNSYWADGLIVATPTGSTAYSLSVGGPIVVPGSKNFIVSPISPHTLAVRPVVVPDYHEIKLKVDARSNQYLVSADFKSMTVDASVEIVLKKAKEVVKTINLNSDNFYSIIRSKLMWGIDKRN